MDCMLTMEESEIMKNIQANLKDKIDISYELGESGKSICVIHNKNVIELEFNLIHCKNHEFIINKIAELTKLKTLYLNNNEISNIPETIGNLSKLKGLNIGGNRLSVLPDSMGKLKNLEILILGYNILTTLPKSLENLTHLKIIDLIDNNIESIDFDISKLNSLKKIYLSSNKIVRLPEMISLKKKI